MYNVICIKTGKKLNALFTPSNRKEAAKDAYAMGYRHFRIVRVK